MRTPTVVILATAALAAVAPPASATITSSYVGTSKTLTVTSDDAGETIAVTCVGGALHVNGVDPPHGPLACAAPSVLDVVGNGGTDTLDVSGIKDLAIGTVTVDGGEGDDAVSGVFLASNGYTVTLRGGGGADTLTVNGSDVASGGPGDDRIVGPVQDGGTLNGDAGTDTFAYDFSAATPVSYAFTFSSTGMSVSAPGVAQVQTLPFTSIEVADLVLGEGGQTVDGSPFPGSLRVDAGGGADSITGTSADDVLNGGPGNDFLDGGGGADVYQGGGGLDLLHARDGVADTGDCGADEDTLVADAIDALTGCERVDLPVVVAPPDTTKPVLAVRRATLRNRRLRLPVSCPAAETRCAGIVTLAAVGRRKGASVRVRLGAITFRIAGGKSTTLTRRVSRGKVRALGRLRGARLRVSVDVLDAAGNRAKGVQRVRLRR